MSLDTLVADLTPSVSQPRLLRPDLVLIALPPRDRQLRGGVLVLPKQAAFIDRTGIVVQVGAGVTVVQPQDRVIFDNFSAEEVRVNDWPCVLVTETAIDAVMEDGYAG